MLYRIVGLVSILGISACSWAPRVSQPSSLGTEAVALRVEQDDANGDVSDEPEGEEGRSLLTSVLLYLPNRILDIGDVARAGVDVGPGMGLDARVTRFVQAAMVSRTSVGVGYQTFRHLPVHAGVESTFAVGPVGVSPNIGVGWYKSGSDVRLELHVLIVGLHVAVDPLEVVDLAGGILGLDLLDDDL